MKNKRLIILMWVLSLLPLAAVLLLMNRLPQQIPMHWASDGTIRYGSVWELLMLTGLNPLLALLFQFLPRIDPRKKSYARFQGYYDSFGVGLMVFLLLTDGMVLSECLFPGRIVMYRAVGMLLGLLLLFLGNLQGKVKQTFFMGIRTPWTLSDPDVWNRTQRLGGMTLFAAGLASIALCCVLSETVYYIALLGILAAAVLLPICMSWVWYRKGAETGKEA